MADIEIKLSNAEAIVLFEFLSRTNKEEKQLAIEHISERRVLWNTLCLLERALEEPFADNYDVLLQEARNAIVRS